MNSRINSPLLNIFYYFALVLCIVYSEYSLQKLVISNSKTTSLDNEIDPSNTLPCTNLALLLLKLVFNLPEWSQCVGCQRQY